MIDTGCRRACGGRLWHERLREELDARGVRYYREEALEYFQFGPGEPIASNARWTYDVGIFGAATQLDIYELDSVSTAIDQAPGLIGPDELAKWQGNIYFTDDTVEVFGRRGKIARAASGHPCISLLGFPETDAAEEVASADTTSLHSSEILSALGNALQQFPAADSLATLWCPPSHRKITSSASKMELTSSWK